MLRLYNTLTRKKEDFQTLEPNIVRLYVCGVTVYADAHVGHAMSALVFDIIRRYLEYRGYNVRHVMNYTDVDDKIISRANQLGEDPLKLSQRYIEDYAENLADLNVLPATSYPQVSKTMPLIIKFIEGLIEKGYAYAADNGDVYFRVTRDEDYGKLSGRKLDDMQAGARIEVGEAKEHPMDFALWKAAKPGEIFWESPWGKGRPGWHIECSAMAMKYLGETFDLHAGGMDLQFPHHENEIAQSEGSTGKLFAKYWIHSEFLKIDDVTMSKSKGNFFTFRDLKEQGYSPLAMRYLLLSVPYRKQLNFTFDGLQGAESTVERLRNFRSLVRNAKPAGGNPNSSEGASSPAGDAVEKALADFETAMDDDFNTAAALASIHDLVREINTILATDLLQADDQIAVLNAISKFDSVLGIFGREDSEIIDDEIEALIAERQEARHRRDFARSDEIRDLLVEKGIVLEDTKDGVRWKRK